MALPPRLVLLACCLLTLLSAAGATSARNSRLRVLRLDAQTAVGCVVLTPEEADRLERSHGEGQTFPLGGPLGDRIANRRTSPRPGSRRPDPTCPRGLTYFDGCNSCSCGEDQLCTLKACNAETRVDIFDPCIPIKCGYHQKCRAICVGDKCQLQGVCVSDDAKDCHNCPWICVDERIRCPDTVNRGRCEPTLVCYRPPMF